MQTSFSKQINELLVLAVVSSSPAHGYQIALTVNEKTGGLFSFQHGTLYPILHRLEAEGSLKGQWSGGKRRRKTYRLTAAGQARLKRASEDLERDYEAIVSLLRGNSAA